MKTIASLVASFALLCLTVKCASADTLLSNLSEPNSSVWGVKSGPGGGQDAIQFFTGSLAPEWNLDSVTLSFGGPAQWGARDSGPILYSASIYNGASNMPTSKLAFLGSFNFTNQTASVLQIAFNPSTPVTIGPNSEYWIMVGAVTTCPNGILEGTGSSYNEVADSGWQFGENAFLFTDGTFFGSPDSATPFLQIQATVQTVPEPSTLASAGLVAAIAVCRRCKRPPLSGQAKDFPGLC